MMLAREVLNLLNEDSDAVDILLDYKDELNELIKVMKKIIDKLIDMPENTDFDKFLKDIGYQKVINNYDKWGDTVDGIIGSFNPKDRHLDIKTLAKMLSDLNGYEPLPNILISNDLNRILQKMK